MIIFHLITEFIIIGFLAIGGGMTVVPFIQNIAQTTGWVTEAQIIDMILISEMTPGPMAVSMSAYVGFFALGIPGALSATLALIAPQTIIVYFVYKMLVKFKENKYVSPILEGLKPIALALIVGATLTIFYSVFLNFSDGVSELSIHNMFNWNTIILGVILVVLMQTQKIHPLIYIAISGIVGAVFGFV